MSESDNLFAPRFSIKDVTIHKKDRVYKQFFAMDRYEVSYKKFSGGETKVLVREVFERDADAVAVLVWDEKTDEVALIEQFRPGALKDAESPWLIEIVAGIIDKGESCEQTAIREVKEEIGIELKPEDLCFITSEYPSPGGISEMVTLYVAKADLSKLGNHGGLEIESEDIRVFKAKLDDAYENVMNGRIHNSVAIIAIMNLKWEKAKIVKRLQNNKN
ncbi:MAG: NUDIX domain-containing protein [Succinivibrio sp.]|nr:NUDIX domain-containing protein [Succinivibrio sp.]